MGKKLDIFIDGACSGNPGAAAIGAVIKAEGKIVREISRSIGIATNNVAEYTALIHALQEALVMQAQEVSIHTDSELLFNQLRGSYKVKNENIKSLFEQIRHLSRGFKRIEMKRVPRSENKQADVLAKKAIQAEQAKVVASNFVFGEESPSSKG